MKSFLAHRMQRTVLNGKSSRWGTVTAGVPQGSILGPLFFLIYIKDLTDGLKCNVKLFADDTSIFTVVHEPTTAAENLNHDLDLINLWATKWRMPFNPDPSKQAVEVIFSKKRCPRNHPPYSLKMLLLKAFASKSILESFSTPNCPLPAMLNPSFQNADRNWNVEISIKIFATSHFK